MLYIKIQILKEIAFKTIDHEKCKQKRVSFFKPEYFFHTNSCQSLFPKACIKIKDFKTDSIPDLMKIIHTRKSILGQTVVNMYTGGIPFP